MTALRFATETAANDWLSETGHYGRVHRATHDFIIVRFDAGRVWAFASPTELVHLNGW